MWYTLMWALLMLTAIVLILLVLVQRGKGGGLAGALGGMGGQSAFGTKAGDTFTRITVGVAAFWIILCMVAVGTMKGQGSKLDLGSGPETETTTGDTFTPGATDDGDSDAVPAGDAGEPATDDAAE
jgi:preprotein translocase subunit SecG